MPSPLILFPVPVSASSRVLPAPVSGPLLSLPQLAAQHLSMPVTVQKLGVRLSPPSLLLVYRPEGAGVGLRLRKMPVKSLTAVSSCGRVAQELRQRHQPHLDTVPQTKLLKMLRILQVGTI